MERGDDGREWINLSPKDVTISIIFDPITGKFSVISTVEKGQEPGKKGRRRKLYIKSTLVFGKVFYFIQNKKPSFGSWADLTTYHYYGIEFKREEDCVKFEEHFWNALSKPLCDIKRGFDPEVIKQVEAAMNLINNPKLDADVDVGVVNGDDESSNVTQGSSGSSSAKTTNFDRNTSTANAAAAPAPVSGGINSPAMVATSSSNVNYSQDATQAEPKKEAKAVGNVELKQTMQVNVSQVEERRESENPLMIDRAEYERLRTIIEELRAENEGLKNQLEQQKHNEAEAGPGRVIAGDPKPKAE